MKKKTEDEDFVPYHYRNPFSGYRGISLEYIAFKMSPFDIRTLIEDMVSHIDALNKKQQETDEQLFGMVNGSMKSGNTLLAATMAGVLIATPEKERTPELLDLVDKIAKI
jgi:hypothetical protein